VSFRINIDVKAMTKFETQFVEIEEMGFSWCTVDCLNIYSRGLS